jgi:hypothetical protein
MYGHFFDANESITDGRQIPYILAEAPSNLLLKKFRPSVWLARIMVGYLLKYAQDSL